MKNSRYVFVCAMTSWFCHLYLTHDLNGRVGIVERIVRGVRVRVRPIERRKRIAAAAVAVAVAVARAGLRQ